MSIGCNKERMINMFKLRFGIEIEEVGDEIIVIDSTNGRFLEINQMGHIILSKLIEGVSPQEISEELSIAYDKQIDESVGIVTDYINKLKELEILCSDV